MKQTYQSPPLQDDISASISNSNSESLLVESQEEHKLNDDQDQDMNMNNYGYSTPNKMVKVRTYSNTGTTEDVIPPNTNSPSTTLKHRIRDNTVMEDISEHQDQIDDVNHLKPMDIESDNVKTIEEEEIITDDKKTQ